MNRVTSMVDAAATTVYSYTIAGRLFTEDGPWASDTVTNYYDNGLRTHFVLAQPTGSWTNVFGYDLPREMNVCCCGNLRGAKRVVAKRSASRRDYLTGRAKRLTGGRSLRGVLVASCRAESFCGKLLLAQEFWVCCIAFHA